MVSRSSGAGKLAPFPLPLDIGFDIGYSGVMEKEAARMTKKEAVAKVIEVRHGKAKAQEWMSDPTGNRMIAVHTAMSIIALQGREKADFFLAQAKAVAAHG